MSLVSSHDWHDHIDLIEGEPDPEDLELRKQGEHRKQLQALCLLCYKSHSVGSYVYVNYPIELEDGTTTTFEDWRAEAGRNRVGKSRRRRMYCPRCDFLTEHVAEL